MSSKPTIDSVLFDHETKSYFQAPTAPFQAYDGGLLTLEPNQFPRIPSDTNTLVVKVGTSVITHKNSERGNYNMQCIAEDLTALRKEGMKVLLVTSGAIGMGRKERLKRDEHIPYESAQSPQEKQKDAIVGQPLLYERWKWHFGSQRTIERLVTHEDMATAESREKLLWEYAKEMSKGAIPIINENDAKSLEEIEKVIGGMKVFSDNDMLGAMHAVMLRKYGFKVLMIGLSNTDGIYTQHSFTNGTYEPIRLVKNPTGLLDEADEKMSARGRGGMFSKIDSASYAAQQGVNVVILNGQYCNHDAPLRRGIEGAVRRYRPISSVLDGKVVGTRFVPYIS